MNKSLNPLKLNHLFTKAYRNGVSDTSKLCAVYILKNIRKTSDGSPLPTTMGISVNAKLGGAVMRNRVKRIIREGYRQCLPDLKPGLIIIIAARGAAFSRSCKSTMMAKAVHDSLYALGAYNGQSLKVSDSKPSGKGFYKNKGGKGQSGGKSKDKTTDKNIGNNKTE